MVGELHCHTKHSLPKWLHRKLPTAKELVDKAVALGLDFIAITDHDSQIAYPEINEYALERGLVIIPSVEISAKSSKLPHKRPHILAYGVPEKIPSRKSIDLTIELIHAQDGIAVAAHPYGAKYSKSTFIGDDLKNHAFDGIEVFNSEESEKSNAQAQYMAEQLDLLPFAGSDAHDLSFIGHALIRINIPKTDDWRILIAAIKNRQYDIMLTQANHDTSTSSRLHSSSISFIYRSIRGKAS
jgi:predicted metal-dependent phosphoesterase TrpH